MRVREGEQHHRRELLPGSSGSQPIDEKGSDGE